MNDRDLLELLIKEISKNVANSQLLASEIADKVSKNPRTLEAIVASLDAELLASSIAQRIIQAEQTKAMSVGFDSMRSNYKTVMIDAKKLATEMIAKSIVEETRSI